MTASPTIPRAFCELPAGLASVSLRLHGGPHCRPPISRMGNKAGYAEVILAALGLRSGQGAGAYVWAEADPDVRALLRAYPDPEMLRRIADIIRGWKDEEPRALWERLRAERKARNLQATHDVASDRSAAEYVFLVTSSHDSRVTVQNPGFVHPEEGGRYGAGREDTADRCHRLAEYASIVAEPAAAWAWLQSRSVGGIPASEGLPFYGPTMPAGDPKDALRGRRVATCDGVAQGFERVAGQIAAAAAAAVRTMPQAAARGASDGDFLPRVVPSGVVRYAEDAPSAGFDALSDAAVAGWIQESVWSYRQGDVESGGPVLPGDRRQDTTATATATAKLRLVSRWPPVAVLATLPTAAELSAMLGTPGDLDGVVVYMDPPYVGTTGYLHDLPREVVVRLAREYDALGAVVCISEAEPVIDGWHVADIAGGRKGQKRTFSKQQREVLTMNREPAHRVAVQASLFGDAKVSGSP